MKKPRRLRKGSKLAILSPSWGGPSLFPHIYESGIENLQDLGFNTVEYPTARMSAEDLYKNPQLRAEDIHAAFSDPEIDGIISTIGGTDSARVLKFLDMDLIKHNHKFLMGYSDITTFTTWLNQHGLITFNGPSVMAGFSQFKSFDGAYRQYIENFLFSPQREMDLPEFPAFSDGYPHWGDRKNVGLLNDLQENDGMHFIQGAVNARGRLFGGCIEVLEMLKGTDFWPGKSFWDGRILFLETSEDKPPVEYVQYWLRNYGVMGVFDRLAGILFARPRSYSAQDKKRLEEVALSTIRDEFGNAELPIVCNVDFGHTDPQVILPLGIEFEIDVENRKVRQLENPFGEDFA
jgi:muramoyltetrapeptide carboxypeptidase LdcA involved in peptidoglycan recycling